MTCQGISFHCGSLNTLFFLDLAAWIICNSEYCAHEILDISTHHREAPVDKELMGLAMHVCVRASCLDEHQFTLDVATPTARLGGIVSIVGSKEDLQILGFRLSVPRGEDIPQIVP